MVLLLIISGVGYLYRPAGLTDMAFGGWGQGQSAVGCPQSDCSSLLITVTEQREGTH